MKAKHIIALLLAAIMLLAATAACTGTSDDPGGGATTPGGGTTTPGGDSDPNPNNGTDSDPSPGLTGGAPIDKWAPEDMGGRNIVIGWNSDMLEGKNFAITHSPAPDPAVDSPYYIAMWDNFKRIEEKYNVVVTNVVLNFGDMLPQLALAKMAGEEFCDIIWFNSQFIVPAIANDLVYDISEIAPADADYNNAQRYLINPGSILGKNVFMSTNDPLYNADIIIVNQDIITSIGAQDPVDLYKNGQWTWDNFFDIARSATRDTNNSGAINQWGLSGWIPWIANAAIASNGSNLSDYTTLKVNYNSSPVLEAMQFLQDLLLADRVIRCPEIDGAFDIWDWGNTFDAFGQGNVAMGVSRFWAIPATEDDWAWPFQYSVVPFPTGPSNTIDGPTYFIEFSASDFIIPTTAKTPEQVYKVFEEMQYWWDDDLEFAHAKTLDYLTTLVHTFDDAYRIIEASERYAIDLIPFISGGGVGDILWPLLIERETPAQVVAANEQVLQDTLDRALGPIDTDAYLDEQRRLEEALNDG